MEKYFTIGKEGFAEYKVLGSRFMAFAYPVKNKEAFKTRLDYLRKLHPKASHHCFAYRLGTDNNVFRVSDDGEPSGTAGKPILGQLDASKLTNALVVVVRYFGGTLLGIPRLTNAYRTSASLVLQCTPLIEKYIMKSVFIECNYPELDSVLRILQQAEADILKKDLQLFCGINTNIPVSGFSSTLRQLGQIKGVSISEI